MHSAQEIVDPEESHQHGGERNHGRQVEEPQAVQAFHQVEMGHHGIDDHRDQRPGLLRVPPPVTAPGLVCPDGSEESADGHQGKPYPERHLAHDAQFGDTGFQHLFVLLPGNGHHHHIGQPDQATDAEETVSGDNDCHMEHQPRRFQDRDERVDLRVHPVQAGHEEDDTAEEGGQCEGDRAATHEQEAGEDGRPPHVDHRLVGVAPGGIASDIPAHPHTEHVVVEDDQHTDPCQPGGNLHPTAPAEQHREGQDQQEPAQDQVADLAIAEDIHPVILQFGLHTLRTDIECLVLGLLVGVDHADHFVGFRPVAAFQGFLHFAQIPLENAGDEHGVFAAEGGKVVAGCVPFMVRIVFFGEEVQHLVVDQLMEDVQLFVQFHQVLVEARALGRHLVVGFFELLLQLVVAVVVEDLDIGALAVRQAIAGCQFGIGEGDKGNAHPHIRHGQEAQEELVGIELADLVRLMELTENLGRERVDRHHTAVARLDRESAEAGSMFRTDRIFLHGIEHRGCFFFCSRLHRDGKEGKQYDRHAGRFAQFFQAAALAHEAGVLADQTKDQTDEQQQIACIGDVPSRHVAVDGKDGSVFVLVVRGLEEAIAFYIQHVIHKDAFFAVLPVHMDDHFALVGRGTGGTGIAG